LHYKNHTGTIPTPTLYHTFLLLGNCRNHSRLKKMKRKVNKFMHFTKQIVISMFIKTLNNVLNSKYFYALHNLQIVRWCKMDPYQT